jgi:hypothetical protein
MLVGPQLKVWIGEHFNLYLLGVVLLILAAGVLASMWANRRPGPPAPFKPAVV